MVQISDHRLGQNLRFAPLPPFATPEELLADALPVLDPPSRMSVTDAAERYMRIQAQGAWQPFDRMVTPYMVEPTDLANSRVYKACVFMGPVQSGKTLMLLTVAMHSVMCDPNPMLIVHMSAHKQNEWVEAVMDPVIMNSPAIRDRLGRAREDSTFSRKRFVGMRIIITPPTIQRLSGGSYAKVLETDYDHLPRSLGMNKDNPESSPFTAATQRVQTFLSRGFVLVESTPAYPVTDTSWHAPEGAPHMMPPVDAGIARLYNEGTRARWYWECPDCAGEFEPRFDRLEYDDNLDPGAAGRTATMPCPHCGSVLEHRHKMEMNRAALRGRGGWRHETGQGVLCALGDAAIRDTTIASYALNGAAATFANWPDLVAKYETARRQFEALGDETELRGVVYQNIGLPYCRPKGDDDELTAQVLRNHAPVQDRGVAPEWARFITISVDVQGTWFPVQVTAWGEHGQAQIVDRFDLTQPPAGAPGAVIAAETQAGESVTSPRRLDPARYAEDWQVLEALADRVTPVAGASYGLRPLIVTVDFQGAPGVSDNAEAFLRDRIRAGQGPLWRLTRGQGGWRTPFRVKYEAPDRGHGGKRARGIKLLTIATDRVKDTVSAALARMVTGAQGALWLPGWLAQDEALVGEYIAEERTGDGWQKRRGVIRNEGTDLTVQARAAAEYKGLLRVDWAAPPAWAVGGAGNANAVEIADGQTDTAGDAAMPARSPAKPAAPKRTRVKYLDRR